jgi:hypothetical protein
VLRRAREVLASLELNQRPAGADGVPLPQMDLFGSATDPGLAPLKGYLESLDVENLTPLQALQELDVLKRMLPPSTPSRP